MTASTQWLGARTAAGSGGLFPFSSASLAGSGSEGAGGGGKYVRAEEGWDEDEAARRVRWAGLKGTERAMEVGSAAMALRARLADPAKAVGSAGCPQTLLQALAPLCEDPAG
jgi:hypothetical protein